MLNAWKEIREAYTGTITELILGTIAVGLFVVVMLVLGFLGEGLL